MATSSILTAEAACAGHPDKVCDQVADAILDAVLANDARALVGCEATACRNKLHVFGEVSTTNPPDYETVIRQTLRRIGYTDPGTEFCADTCQVQVDLHEQSPDITRSVERFAPEDAGAGDAGNIVGYACDETDDYLPLPLVLARRIAQRLEHMRTVKALPLLLPDGKVQVSIQYDDYRPARIVAVVVCAQHLATTPIDLVREQVEEQAVRPVLPQKLVDQDTLVYVNPTGRFVEGGPAAKAGLSGRKSAADTYGSCAPWSGSALSGKDPTKVNRSGAYLARWIAKNIVAAELAHRCEVRLSYALGLADPVTVSISTFGTGIDGLHDDQLTRWVLDNVDMRPAMIIDRFNLRRVTYLPLSVHGHFGANAADQPWEQTDLAPRLTAAFAASK